MFISLYQAYENPSVNGYTSELHLLFNRTISITTRVRLVPNEGNTLEKALNKIGREDIVKKCIFNVELVTDDVEKEVARVRLDQPGFDSLKEELGPSRDSSLRRDGTLGDRQRGLDYDEPDRMRDAESMEDLKAVGNVPRKQIDENNIFRSRYEDVEIFPDYVHRYVWKNVHNWWDKNALVCAQTGRAYTYKDLRELSGRFATSLRRRQTLSDTTLAVILPNIPEYGIVILGASEAGIRLTLANPAYTAFELSRQLENSDANTIITNNENYHTIMEAIKMGNISIQLPLIVVTDEGHTPSGTINFRDLISEDVEEFEKTGEKTAIDVKNDTFLLPYSSGTTGLPKGVELTHRHLVTNLCQLEHPDCNYIEPARNGFQDIVPAFLPLYHVYGLNISFLCCLSYGAQIICMPKFTSKNLLNILEKYRATLLFAVPPVIQLLVNDDSFNAKHLNALKVIVSAAAPLANELITKFRKKMGWSMALIQGYGLTEVSSTLSSGKHASMNSVGFLIPNTEMRIISPENIYGKNLGVGQIGEILVRGEQVMKGYYKNVKATKECMDNNWFKTGDLGYIDEIGRPIIHHWAYKGTDQGAGIPSISHRTRKYPAQSQIHCGCGCSRCVAS
ncbi:uncharacterized protein LOC135169824 isoform X2 [Diachasmimorpha longicaudata]|uniref:uncharacterized protein LOC135169824 isoform X2 n=1 Tax=Diachasmimorpha longicaudata TaxID=58733 RepID=UPI0030B8B84A